MAGPDANVLKDGRLSGYTSGDYFQIHCRCGQILVAMHFYNADGARFRYRCSKCGAHGDLKLEGVISDPRGE